MEGVLRKKVENYLDSLDQEGIHRTDLEMREGIRLLLEIELKKDLNSRKNQLKDNGRKE